MTKESNLVGQVSVHFESASSAKPSETSVSPERAARINSWADQATARVVENYNETCALWVNEEYGRLLGREGERRSLQPGWATDDRKAHLMRAAEYIVNRKFMEKLDSINQLAEQLLSGKSVKGNSNDRGR